MGRLQSFFVHSLAVANMITMQRTSSAQRPEVKVELRTTFFIHDVKIAIDGLKLFPTMHSRVEAAQWNEAKEDERVPFLE